MVPHVSACFHFIRVDSRAAPGDIGAAILAQEATRHAADAVLGATRFTRSFGRNAYGKT